MKNCGKEGEQRATEMVNSPWVCGGIETEVCDEKEATWLSARGVLFWAFVDRVKSERRRRGGGSNIQRLCNRQTLAIISMPMTTILTN
jgi:hypothetical protein